MMCACYYNVVVFDCADGVLPWNELQQQLLCCHCDNFQLPHRRQGPLPYFGCFFFRRKTMRNLELRRFGECGEELPEVMICRC